MYLIPNLGFVCRMKRLNALGTCFKKVMDSVSKTTLFIHWDAKPPICSLFLFPRAGSEVQTAYWEAVYYCIWQRVRVHVCARERVCVLVYGEGGGSSNSTGKVLCCNVSVIIIKQHRGLWVWALAGGEHVWYVESAHSASIEGD